MRCAVIDLGTNTFHLLIVEKDKSGTWTPLVRHRVFVKLAEDGIRVLSPKAIKRGLDALKAYQTQLDAAQIRPQNIKAFGTAALRTAVNAPDFIKKARELYKINIETITGEEEATYIFNGVKRAVPFPEGKVLIMDVGGGSVEFIIADRTKVYWQGSFEIGVSVLYRHFHKHEPIRADEILAIEDYLDISLKSLWAALEKHEIVCLIGASGAFDVIDHFLLDPLTKPTLYGWVRTSQFEQIKNLLVKSSLEERKQMPQLSAERMEMIVVAVILIDYIVKRVDIPEIYTSEYALKEGMLELLFKAK